MPNKADDHVISDLTPTGYSFHHVPRPTRGGGVGVLLRNTFNISKTTNSSHQFQSFEFMDMQIRTSTTRNICIVIFYCPPPLSNRNYFTNLSLAEFGSLLEQYVSDPASLLIAGDFNFHVDNSADKTSQDFQALIHWFNLKQHVLSPTHRAGHTLDLLITIADDDLVTSLSTYDADFSDHFVVNCNLTIEKPLFTKKDIYFRACKTINMDLFLNDLQESCLLRNPPDDLNELVALYDSDLAEILNKHAPMKKRSVTI